ncbi:MAG: DDE-type integrase/transposase/recombinase [Kofleriaceae bacterium]|nr:DDE-type integrase/transposase/recombinase [Kofleriaceae bacterium]
MDWAFVSKLPFPGGERQLWLFVMVLAHSRAMWGEFVLDLSVHSLCRSLVRASSAFGGVPRQWLFDNPKTIVLERVGTAVRFHRRCSRCVPRCASSRDCAPWRGPSTRARSSGPSATCATASSPAVPSPASTTATARWRDSSPTSATRDRTHGSHRAPSRTSLPPSGRGSCRS